jgi:hypothetical protein
MLVGASVLALGLGACGGDDGGGAQASEQYLDALIESMMSTDDGDEPLTTDEDEARCAAERMTEEVGQERLEDAGMTIEALGESDPFADGTDLTEEESRQVVDAILECVDLGASMAASFTSGGDGLPAGAADCLGERFERSDEFRDFLALSLREGDDAGPQPDFAALFSDALFDCVDFGEIFASGLGVELTDEEVACLDDAIRESEVLRELMTTELSGGGTGDVPPEVFDLVSECVPASKLAGITDS